MNQTAKIALGVGCGILLAVAVMVGGCLTCAGVGLSAFSDAQKKVTQGNPGLKLRDQDWKFTRDGSMGEITGQVRNTTGARLSSAMIEFDLYDAAGNKVGNATDLISGLDAGEVWKFKAVVFEDSARTAKLARLSGY